MPSDEDPYPDHWYDVVEDSTLRQGDIFRDLPVFLLPEDLTVPERDANLDELEIEIDSARGDWIVLTSSCDLHQTRCSHALLARVEPATPKAMGVREGKDYDAAYEVVRKGLDPAKFMLADCDALDPSFPVSIAYYRTNVHLPLGYLQSACKGPRLRLRHPFREKLGKWAADCLAAVGPEDHALIPSNGKQIFPAHVLKAVSD